MIAKPTFGNCLTKNDFGNVYVTGNAVPDSVISIIRSNSADHVITTVRCDANGHFSVDLAPGQMITAKCTKNGETSDYAENKSI